MTSTPQHGHGMTTGRPHRRWPAMGFNYNGKLRCGEVLMRADGSFVQIRRRETIDDLFATLDLNGVKNFN